MKIIEINKNICQKHYYYIIFQIKKKKFLAKNNDQ